MGERARGIAFSLGAACIGVALVGSACSATPIGSGLPSADTTPPRFDSGADPDAEYDASGTTFPGRCTMPILVHVTVSGLQDCACLNGRFTLQKASNEPYLWSSGKIEGCPGQTGPAFYKFVNDPKSPELGVTDLESSPGSGRSNVSPAETVSCSPLAITGGRPTAGNITAFCPKGVETGMRWVVEP